MHVLDATSQAKLTQSASARHVLPLSHGGQAPPQSTSVHAPETHACSAEQICPSGQSSACTHGTHWPEPSHSLPPPAALHGVSTAAGAVPGTPAPLQVPTRHALAGVGTLPWS